MLVGYARISIDDQNLTLQTGALKEISCTKIYEDKISGTKNNRPDLQLSLEVLRDGDTNGFKINRVFFCSAIK